MALTEEERSVKEESVNWNLEQQKFPNLNDGEKQTEEEKNKNKNRAIGTQETITKDTIFVSLEFLREEKENEA